MKYKKYFFFFIFVIILLISLNDYKKEEKLYHIQQQSIKKIDNINIPYFNDLGLSSESRFRDRKKTIKR